MQIRRERHSEDDESESRRMVALLKERQELCAVAPLEAIVQLRHPLLEMRFPSRSMRVVTRVSLWSQLTVVSNATRVIEVGVVSPSAQRVGSSSNHC